MKHAWRCSSGNDAVNQVTVAHELARQSDNNDRDLLTIVGGAEYLSALVSNVPTSVHIEHYAGIVYRTSVLRQIIRAGVRIVDMGHEGVPDENDVLSRAEEVLYGVRTGHGARDFAHIRVFLDNYMEQTGRAGRPGGDVACASSDRFLQFGRASGRRTPAVRPGNPGGASEPG